MRGTTALPEAEQATSLGLAKRLATHSALYGVPGALAKALALLTVPYLSRTLSADGYGLADLGTSLAALLTIVAAFAGDIATAHEAARATSGHKRRTVMAMYLVMTAVTSIGIALLVLPAAAWIAASVWSAPGEAHLVFLALALVPLSAIQAAAANLQRLESRPVRYAQLAVVDLVLQLALAVLFVAVGLGPTGVLVGFIGGSCVGLALALVAARPLVALQLDWRVGRRIILLGIRFLPAAVFFVAADYVSRALVANSFGEAGVGYFAVGLRIASVMSLVTYAFSLAWAPLGLQLRPGAGTWRLFRTVLTWYVVLSGSAGVLLAAMAPEAVLVASGEGFLPATQLLPGLVWAAAAAGTYFVLLIAAGVVGRTWATAVSSAVGATSQVVAVAVLLPISGLSAVGIGAVAGQLAALLTMSIALRLAIWSPVAAGLLLIGAVSWILLMIGLPITEVALGVRIAVGGALSISILAVAWMSTRRAAESQGTDRLD